MFHSKGSAIGFPQNGNNLSSRGLGAKELKGIRVSWGLASNFFNG